MCFLPHCTLSKNPHLHIEDTALNMDWTNEMWELANRVSLVTNAFPLFVWFSADLIKKGLYLLYNALVCVINTAFDLFDKLVHTTQSIYDTLRSQRWGDYFVSPFEASCFSFDRCFEPEGRLAQLCDGILCRREREEVRQRIIGTQFNNEDLATFRLCMQTSATQVDDHQRDPRNEQNPILVYLQDHQCARGLWQQFIWYNVDDQKIYLQNRQIEGHPTLAMGISDVGYVTSLQLDGVAQDAFPDIFAPYMYSCFQEAYAASSQYQTNHRFNVRVVREGLKQSPDFHLQAFRQQLNVQHRALDLNVKFLNFDLTDGEGFDAGGPRRDYIDDLWEGLLNGNSQVLEFTRQPQNSDAMPKTNGVAEIHGIPRVTEQERSLLESLGAIIMYCYEKEGALPIGRRFEEGLFKAILSLTDDEIDAEDLPFPVQLKMMRAILECREVPINNMHPLFHLLEHEAGDMDWVQARYVAEHVVAAEGIPTADDFDKNPAPHQQLVINVLKEFLYASLGSSGSAILSPIHHIAKGIKNYREHLGEYSRGNPGFNNWRTFSDTVQGTLDRDFIAGRIHWREGLNQNVIKKAWWVREWILDPQTRDDQIQAFIKFATGSSSLPLNDSHGRISINVQVEPYLPVPRAHTCSGFIDISPVDASYGEHHDRTKQDFIRSLIELSNADYQME